MTVLPVTAYATLQCLGRGAGSTRAERREPLPGDDLVVRPQVRTDHAVTISAPVERVWPWLTQMGWHLGGYYTAGWVDRVLFPGNWTSLDTLDPCLVRQLRPGDRIPDGPPGTAEYVVEARRRPAQPGAAVDDAPPAGVGRAARRPVPLDVVLLADGAS